MQKPIYLFLILMAIATSSFAQKKEKNEKSGDRGATYGDDYKGSGYKSKQKIKYDNLDFDKKVKEFDKSYLTNCTCQYLVYKLPSFY